jgi:ribose transport system substrate-binding protein
MTFDSDAPQSKRFAFYGVDDAKAGQQTMAELAKLLDGKGNVAILAGNQNAPNLQKRVQGAKTEAAKYPGIKIVGVFNHVETPQDASAEVIRVNNAYPEITGWAFIGGWPLFATSLLSELNPAKQKSPPVDAIPSSCRTSRRESSPCCSRSRCICGATSAFGRSSTRSTTTSRRRTRSCRWSSFASRRRTSATGRGS